MRISHGGLLVAFLFLMGGCATPEQRAAQERQQAAERAAFQARIRAAIEKRCKDYGFQPGTPSFSNCLMQMDQRVQQGIAAKQAKEARESQCLLAHSQFLLGGGSIVDGNAVYERCMAGMPPAAPSRPVQLNCRKEGLNQVNCYGQ